MRNRGPKKGKGPQNGQGVSNKLRRCSGAIGCASRCSGGSGRRRVALGGRGAERAALFIAVGDATRAPIGWVEFCIAYKAECDTKPSRAARRRADAEGLDRSGRVNAWVNDTIKPMTDLEHWGVVERWNYPDDGYGDCEDYVLPSAAC